ncbi:carboxypeptidase regulatory-like domain-containing protein [Symmachiella dynata]|mgnify:CR=1 FL=1|uniref:Nickel uptake substrate-specific transmembrane region n=1 Tax=Symmachiella dynata TaxID=2527995 RepID=A0A517ZKJ9_9PLAN|nr:carboxypeptidase regulatory-like domain-containing protein [Symmachiella dynata]QDT47409.1 hypothetical protein Pan258_14440 [Symmachiella dynata]QDU42987.1 hypothetical protein Mal52_14580 [Symmachiella dynata]|tara:strand:- start:1164 stop:1571 length:408 start_codon:yes stop_codon:yes gene_type:complete
MKALLKAFKPSAMALVVAIWATSGCGGNGDRPEIGTVEGTITLDGKPFQEVVVVFIPDKGRPSTGVTDEEGRYELKYLEDAEGAKIGHHKVGLAAQEDVQPSAPIPRKYGYGPNTELEAEVLAGDNVLDFKLTSN